MKALDYSMRLLAASEAAGHEGYATVVAVGNISLCLLRIGRYRDAMEWAERINVSTGTWMPARLTQLEVESLASASAGDRTRGRRVASEANKIAVSSCEPWIIRRAHLVVADALHLAGEFRTSREAAKAAIAMGSPLREDPGIAGRYYRWVGAIGAWTGCDLRGTGEVLRDALRAHIDALDSVEVLGALMALDLITSEERQDLQTRMAGLPPAVADQLNLLGAFGREWRINSMVAQGSSGLQLPFNFQRSKN